MKAFILNFFFKIPIWVLKIFFWKKPTYRGHQFDTQSQALISLQPSIDLTELSDKEIPKIRNLIIKNRVAQNLSISPNNYVKKVDHFVGKSKILFREYIPSDISSNTVILFFHGGGYVLNSVDTHDGYVSYMADSLQAKVYSLEYKLAPEHKYPDALNDAIQAYYWLIETGHKPENISVCGDSAGAHLAASLVHKLAQIDEEQIPHSQFLIYPMCDPDCKSDSYNFLSEGYMLTKKTMIWFWDKFSNNIDNINDQAFNLLKLNLDIKIPNTIIITAGFDPLCDDGEKYAYLLHKRGDNVKQLHYPNLFHGFVSVTRLKAAKIAVDDFLGEYRKII